MNPLTVSNGADKPRANPRIRTPDEFAVLYEFGKDRVGEFQAALAKIYSAPAANQQIALEQSRGSCAKNAVEALAEARLEIRELKSVAKPQIQKHELALG